MLATGSAAYGRYSRSAALSDIVSALSHAGFAKQDICMVLAPTHPMASVVRKARISGDETHESTVGARTIGWFSEFGAVVIPDVGFFVRSQVFLNALLAEQSSSALCGGSKILAGLGLCADDAKRLYHALADAGAFVFVSCADDERAEWAVQLLRSTGAREVASLQADGIEERSHQERPIMALALENAQESHQALVTASH